VNLITAMFAAPLIGCDPDTPDVLHAVTMEGLTAAWVPVDGNDPWFSAPCGAVRLKLVGSDGSAVSWPPRVSSLVGSMVRCRDCQRLTGSKRPVSSFRPKANA